jgi:hypothetical protein
MEIKLDDYEAEVLMGFLAELVDDRSPIDNADRDVLDGIIAQLSEEGF